MCATISPTNGDIVSPTNLTIKWMAHIASISSLYLGTNKDNLPCISQINSNNIVLTNLNLNTTYYWYVSSSLQGYSGCSTPISSFRTVPDLNLPYVVTAPVFTHLNTPPRVGGKVWYDGSSKVSECVIYFGLYPNPDIGGTKFQIGNESGLFSDLLSGLNSNTTYFVKTYATNSSGTVLGPEVTFTSGQASDYKSIKDLDGNKYYIVSIGNQVWMAENLKATRFNDGTLFPNITDDFAWETLNTPAYCWYNNNQGFKSTYGALYNWYTIDTASNGHRNVCPAGWHIPSDAEWIILVTNLGGEAGSGIKLKEAGEFYWYPSTNMGDNTSDFSALPGGKRSEKPVSTFDGTSTPFFYIGSIAAWWSNTSTLTDHELEVTVDKSSADKYSSQKNGGYSIRCIKDSK
jgi:uncharacterized protein (TIGR02145 family)